MNGAQTLIDPVHHICRNQMARSRAASVLLLPHGYEGQGLNTPAPRLERFLQQCAEQNIFVTNCTTAASFFHALRRQLALAFPQTDDQLLAQSQPAPRAELQPRRGFYAGRFPRSAGRSVHYRCNPREESIALQRQDVLRPEREANEGRPERCGASYGWNSFIRCRLQQLEAIQQKYKGATWFWVQEEPLNMGAASFLQMNLKQFNYGVISRNPSAATATGYSKVHAQEQQEIIDTAFNI